MDSHDLCCKPTYFRASRFYLILEFLNEGTASLIGIIHKMLMKLLKVGWRPKLSIIAQK